MYIGKVILKNIRGFADLQFDFMRPNGAYAGWTVFTGDNGSGKSTLLKAIAVGLTGKDTARALQPSFHHWIREAMDREGFCTSIVVACELRYSVLKRSSPSLAAKVDYLLAQVVVLPLDVQVDLHYAEVRVVLEKMGQPIGHNDLLIAAHARTLGLTLGHRQGA